MATDVVYDQAFFDLIRPGVQRSAKALVPFLLAELAAAGVEPQTMVDVGCGEGWWTAEFAVHGVDADGIDGPGGGSALPVSQFVQRDLSGAEGLEGLDQYDLALSLEVAEHLPPERAQSFVADLCSLAPVVVFSAAIPGQGGHGHVHEMWPGYWADLFARYGFLVTGDLRYDIWDSDDVAHWYAQNLLVAWEAGACSLTPARPLSLVHPKLWEHYRWPQP